MRTLLFFAYILATPFLAGGLSRSLQHDFPMYDPNVVLGWNFMALILLPIVLVMIWRLVEGVMYGFNEAMHHYHAGNARVARISATPMEHPDHAPEKNSRTRRRRMSGQQIKQRVTRA